MGHAGSAVALIPGWSMCVLLRAAVPSMLKHPPGQDGVGEGRAMPWPAQCPPEVDSGRKDEVPQAKCLISLCLLPSGVVTSLVQMFLFPGWWKSLAASVAGLMPGKELHSSPLAQGQVPCRGMGCSWLKPSLARQLWEDGLEVEVAVDALSGNLLLVLCDVCCFIP